MKSSKIISRIVTSMLLILLHTRREFFLLPKSHPGGLLFGLLSMRRYSCMIQSLLIPFGGLPLQKTSAFFTPTFWLPSEASTGLSVPVAFQYPDVAALFGLAPFGYFRSLGLKKYHSCSPNDALAIRTKQKSQISRQR